MATPCLTKENGRIIGISDGRSLNRPSSEEGMPYIHTAEGHPRARAERAMPPLLWLAALGLLLQLMPVCFAWADAGVIKVQAVTIHTRLAGYGRVEPIAVLNLNAAQTGVVSELAVLPGEAVEAGTLLGRLAGPAVEAALAKRRMDVVSARAELTAAQKIAAIVRQEKEVRLATKKTLDQAEADLTAARARIDNAQTQLQVVQGMSELKAPVDGMVLSVDAAAGEQVQAGQTVLRLQPKGGLWLKAVYYGQEAATVRAGMRGRFEPAGGGPAIAVQVRTVIGPTAPDGGQAVGLVATVPAPAWRNGDAGLVALEGTPQTLAAVPTRALIIDRGRWWVLVRTAQGDQPTEIIPGPSRGESTLVESGIEPGAMVVVENAYLEFHRDFSKQYQPPD
jgi:RND family efflux transporter MFP subunit